MIRIILIFVFIFWVIRSVFKLFAVGLGSAQQQRNFNQQGRYQQQKKPKDGNVNIEYSPVERKKGKKSSDNFKGGDYVDYEELDN